MSNYLTRARANTTVTCQNFGMNTSVLYKLFTVIGLCLILAGEYFRQQAAELVAVAEEAPGIVVALERSGEGSFSPVVQWTDHHGAMRTLYSSLSSRPPRFFEGEQVTILFDPDDPKYPVNARIKSTMDVWGLPIFFFGFGGFWLIVTFVSWYVWSKGGIVVFGEKNYPGRPDPDFPTD